MSPDFVLAVIVFVLSVVVWFALWTSSALV